MPSCERIQFRQPLRAAVLAKQSATVEASSSLSAEELATALREQQGRLEREHAAALEKARAEAEAAGHAAGKAEAEAAARVQAEEKEGHLKTVLGQVEGQLAALRGEVEALLPELIVEGVGRVLHAWKPDGEEVKAVVGELLEGFESESGELRLSVNADDWKALEEEDADFAERYRALEIRKDRELQRGECYLEGRFGVADARFAAKLRSLREVME